MEFSTKISNLAYKKIAEKIATGQLVPGQKVLQVALAKDLNCSTVPVVEAMRRLESEGLLVKEDRKIARVRKLTLEEIEGLYLLREGLESVAARLCAKKITDEQIERLQKLAKQYEESVDSRDEDAIYYPEEEIHKLIVETAGSSLLSKEYSRLLLIKRTAGRTLIEFNKFIRFPRHSHRALIAAISDHDEVSAEYYMKKHIQKGFQAFVEYLQNKRKLDQTGKRGKRRNTSQTKVKMDK